VVIWLAMLVCVTLVYQQRERLREVLGVGTAPPTPGATSDRDARDAGTGALEAASTSDALRPEAGRAPAPGEFAPRAGAGSASEAASGDDVASASDVAPSGETAVAGEVGPPTPTAPRPTSSSPARDLSVAPDPGGAFLSPLDRNRSASPPPTPGGLALPLLDSLLGEGGIENADALRLAGRHDDVFAAVEALAHADLAPGRLRAWRAEHDALLPARLALLRSLASFAADDAALALDRDLPLLAAARADDAQMLLVALERLRAGPAGEPEHAALRARVQTTRAALFGDLDAVRQLAARGATLPADAQHALASIERRWAAADRRRAELGGPASLTRGRLTLHSELPTGVAERLLESAEAALDATEQRWPTTGREPLEIVVHARRSRFDQEADAQRSDVHRDTLAFLDADAARVVTLDPRERGESRDTLHGLVARELARWTIRRAHSVGVPLPDWLEEGWARAFEAWSRSSDGRAWRLGPATRLRERLLLDLGPSGAGLTDLDSLLALRPASERTGPAAWSFVRHLEQARDADGAPLFAEELALLVRSREEGLDLEPRVELALRFMQSDAQRAAGLLTQPRLQAHWQDAERRAAELDTATGDAAAALWEPIDTALGRRDNDVVALRLGELSPLRPLDPALRLRRLQLAERRAERDARLLEALLLARCASDDSALLEQAWHEAGRVNRSITEQLRTHHERGREAVQRLVERHLADDRPEGARLLLDVLTSCQPSDPAWARLAAALPKRGADGAPLALHVHPLLHATGRGVTSESELWQRDADGVRVRCGDRASASTLHALWPLRAPFSLHARLELVVPVPLSSSDEHRRLGLSFGARDEFDPGDWALLFGPGRQVELGVRGNHEWPARALGKAPPRVFALEVRVDPRGFEVRVNEHVLPWQPAGARPLDGRLGVLARQVDAQLGALSVDLRPFADPRGRWELVGAP